MLCTKIAIVGQSHGDDDQTATRAKLAAAMRQEDFPVVGSLDGKCLARRFVAAAGDLNMIGNSRRDSAEPLDGPGAPSERHGLGRQNLLVE